MKTYAKGIYYDLPRENAPEFVLGRLSIKKLELMQWVDQQPANDKGYINLDILMGKENKPYIAVNDYVKKV